MDNPEVVRAFFDAYNNTDVDAIDRLVAEDYVLNDRPLGRDQLKSFIVRIKSGFPDDQMDIQDLITEGDRVVVRLVATGTHAGPHPLVGAPATNKTKATRGIYIFRLVDGRIAEAWDVWDVAGELVQLGLV